MGARENARVLIVVVLGFMAAVSLWTPLAVPRIFERWFTIPNIFYLAPVPIITALVAFAAWRALGRGAERLPFFGSIGLFLLGYLGLVISSYPYLVPPSLTVWQTAAAPESQIFTLVGTAILLPIILCYYAFVYWLFRGKLRAGEGYH
jgi:cytochrome d ubiquinol oxidase subunit II